MAVLVGIAGLLALGGVTAPPARPAGRLPLQERLAALEERLGIVPPATEEAPPQDLLLLLAARVASLEGQPAGTP